MLQSNPRLQGKKELTEALRIVRLWEAEPDSSTLPCPRCSTNGVQIVDRSTRPVAEWYAFNCGTCGLDDALNIPSTIHSNRLD